MLRDQVLPNGRVCSGMFKRWCEVSGNLDAYKDDFTLSDILETLPVYTTTGVSEKRAILKIKTADHGELKRKFQPLFEASWKKNLPIFKKKYGIYSYEAFTTNGIHENGNLTEFSLSGKGGLKIVFKDFNNLPIAFIWMRGSGTEPVFRVMCDVKGDNKDLERLLLEWETRMLIRADTSKD